jgi:hypothetical protein
LEGVNSGMIDLIYCKNFVNATMYPHPAQHDCFLTPVTPLSTYEKVHMLLKVKKYLLSEPLKEKLARQTWR